MHPDSYIQERFVSLCENKEIVGNPAATDTTATWRELWATMDEIQWLITHYMSDNQTKDMEESTSRLIARHKALQPLYEAITGRSYLETFMFERFDLTEDDEAVYSRNEIPPESVLQEDSMLDIFRRYYQSNDFEELHPYLQMLYGVETALHDVGYSPYFDEYPSGISRKKAIHKALLMLNDRLPAAQELHPPRYDATDCEGFIWRGNERLKALKLDARIVAKLNLQAVEQLLEGAADGKRS